MSKKLKYFAKTKYVKPVVGGTEVTIPLIRGMLPLECPNCRQNFNIGVKPAIDFTSWRLHCPYCSAEGGIDSFSRKKASELVSEMLRESIYKQLERGSILKGRSAESRKKISSYLSWCMW